MDSLRALKSSFPDAAANELQRFARARPDPEAAVDMYSAYVQWRSSEGHPRSLAHAFSMMPPLFASGVKNQGPANDGSRTICLSLCRYDAGVMSDRMYVLALCHLCDEAAGPEADDKITLILDIRVYPGAANPGPSDLMGFGRHAAQILSSMYPERMQRAIVYPLSWWAQMLAASILRLVDSKTSDKVVIVAGENTSEDVPADELLSYMSIDSIPIHWWHTHKSLDPRKAAEAEKASSCANGNIRNPSLHDEHNEDEEFFSASEGSDCEDWPIVRLPAKAIDLRTATTKQQLSAGVLCDVPQKCGNREANLEPEPESDPVL